MMNKIKILSSSILLAILIPVCAYATTTITWGVLPATATESWKATSSPYIIPNSIIIYGTLTIEPGVVVRFGSNSDMQIIESGILIAEGTPDANITFTSNQNIHTKGYWNWIEFMYISKVSKLTYCQIEYGGGNSISGYGNIYCDTCDVLPIIATCTISNSSTDGIYSYQPYSSAVLNTHGCIIKDNDRYPVSTSPMIDMVNNTFINNGNGDSARNVIRIFGDTFDMYGINQDITWHNQGIPYLITNGDLVIGDRNAAGTLTIDARVTIRLGQSSSIIIGVGGNQPGCLQAKGTEGAYITFTSNQLTSNPGDWGYIKFDKLSQNSSLEYCNIEYAGKVSEVAKPAVWCQASAPKISHVTISNVFSHGIMCFPNDDGTIPGSPTITYTTIVAGTASCENIPASAIYSRQSCPQIGSSTLMKSKYGMYCDFGNYVGPSVYYRPTIINSNILGNTGYGIYNNPPNNPPNTPPPGSVTATYNWWGTSTNPYNSIGGGNYAGDYVEYAPWIQNDKVSPAPVTLKIKGGEYVEPSTITLHWLPTGDDLDIGTPTYYVINYATTAITNSNWGKVAGSITLNPTDISIVESYYSYPVKDLTPRTEYFFGIKAVDDAGNWSELSNCVGTTTKSTFNPPWIDNNVVNGNKYVKLSIFNAQTNPEVGIWVYYGSKTGVSSANYDGRVDAGTVTAGIAGFIEPIILNLDNGKVYYFVAYAYDPQSITDQNKWSIKSNEVIGSPTVLSTVTITGPAEVIVGGSVTYTAQGYGSFGEKLTRGTYTWNIIPGSLGTLSPTVSTSSTTFYAGTAAITGTLTVQVVDDGTTVTTHLIITLLPGTLTTICILDKLGIFITQATTTAGGSLFFIGSGTDIYGNSAYSFQNYSWQTTIGTINPIFGTSTTLTGTKAITGTLTLIAEGTQTSIRVTILPTSTTKFIFDEISSPQKLGLPFDIRLNSADKFDNPTQDTNITGTVSLSISNNTTILATMSVTSGVGTRSLSITLPATYTIYARGTFTDSPEIILLGTSNPFFVEAGTPTQFVFSLPEGTISIHPAGTATITAYLADNNGFRVETGRIICTLSVNILSGNPGTLGTTSILTDENGQISTTYQVGTTSGSQVRVVISTKSFDGITGTSPLIITKSGPVARFEFDKIDTQAVGIPFWGTITARDTFGNIADFVGTVALSVMGNPLVPGTITPIETGTFTTGCWAGSMTITTVLTDAVITATHSSGAFGTSNPFNVTPGLLHHINLTPLYTTTTVLGTISFTCQGVDEYGNSIDGLTYIWKSMCGIFIPNQGSSTIFTAGTLATIGTISVSSGSKTAIATVTILPGTLTFLSILPSPATMTAGATLTLTAIGYDAYWNQLPTITCTWETNIGTITYELPGTTAVLYATTAGTWIATATANGIATSTIIQISADVLHHFDFSTISDTVAGNWFSFNVNPKDQFGNTTSDVGIILGSSYKGGPVEWNGIFRTDTHWDYRGKFQVVGTYNVIAKKIDDESIRGTSNIFSITPATDTARFNIYIGTTSIPIGGTTSVIIKLEDMYSNSVEIAGTTAELSVIGTGTLNIYSGTTNPEGKIEATFTASIILGTEAVIQVVSVYGTQTSPTITTIPGHLDHFVFAPIPEYGTAGIGFAITILAKDFASNTVTYYNGTATLIVYQDGTPKGTITPNQIRFVDGTATGTVSVSLVIGTVTISAYDEGKSGTSSSINIAFAHPNHFDISSISTQTVGVDFSITIVAKDIAEGTLTGFVGTVALYCTTGTVTIKEGGIGNITNPFVLGVWTGTITIYKPAKNMVVMATYTTGAYGTSNVFVVKPGTISYIVIYPTTPIDIVVDNTCTRTAKGFDGFNNEIEGLIFDWEVTIGTLTHITGSKTTFEAGTHAGIGTLTVRYQLTVATIATITVNPGTPASLFIFPIGATITLSSEVSYEVTAGDSYGNTWTVTSQTEFATNDPLGTITEHGTYTAGKVGTWMIYGTYTKDMVKVATITTVNVIEGTATELSIIPATATIKAGEIITYQAIAKDAKGNTYTVTSQTEFATNDPLGTITEHGTYTAGKVGTWMIYGTYTKDMVKVATTTTVNVIEGTATELSIIPATATIKAGEIITYQAIAKDVKGNTYTVTSQTQFATTDPVNNITEHGTYTAGRVGTWSIRGTYTVLVAIATVYVEHGSGTKLFISPATATVSAAGTISYTTIAQDSQGNTWTVTTETVFVTNDPAGTMTANIYTGGQTGTWTIYATYTLTSIGTTATVYVTVGELDHFKLHPVSIHYFKNEPGTITISVYDKKNNLIATSTAFTLEPLNIITPTSGTTYANGIATMSVTISMGGPVIIKACKDNIWGSISLTILMHKDERGTETLRTEDNLETRVVIPGNTIATDYYVAIGTPTAQTNPDIAMANNNLPSSYKIISSAVREFSIKNEAGGTETLPATATVTITIPYKDINPNDEYVEIDGVKVKENTLWIYRLQNGTWKVLGNQVRDPIQTDTEDWVSAYVGSFSIFTLIGQAVADNLSKVLVYPNPVRVNKGDKEVFFENLTKDAIIRIYTISGELVWIKEGVSENTVLWNLKNEHNQSVASGVYIYIIHDKNEIVKGKIAVIR